MNLKNIIYTIPLAILALSPTSSVFAQAGIADGAITGTPLNTLLINILTFTNGILIPFILGIGFLVFVWGMFQFFIVGGANDDAKEKGKSLMIWAIVGFLMVFVFWGIINLLVSSTGLSDTATTVTPQVVLPK
jgi:hypothetical protein